MLSETKGSLLLFCRPGDEALLRAEVGRFAPGTPCEGLDTGWVSCDMGILRDDAPLCLALASQVLPACEALPEASIAGVGRSAARRIAANLPYDTPWRFHVMHADYPGCTVRASRAELIEKVIEEELGKTRRALSRLRTKDPQAPFAKSEQLAQLALVRPELSFLSICEPGKIPALRRVLSRLPGGLAQVEEDKGPPSRAYLKLLEAEVHLGFGIEAGQTVVDLGASPGGWTYVVLSRGAYVTAVDRSPLRDDLMTHPNLVFCKGDAFRYSPLEPPMDWMISDVVAFPKRILDLLEIWIGAGLCRFFIVTLKFRGQEDYPMLEDVKRLLEAHCEDFFLRRLRSNKNEITVMGATG